MAAKAPVDSQLDQSPRTNEEKAWLYSASRRKAWLKTNAVIGIALDNARQTPYRFPIKRWIDFWNPKTSFSSSWVAPYKMIEARVFLSDKQAGLALEDALDLVELGGKVTHGSIWNGRDNEKDFIESASEIVRESLEQASEADLFQATQRMQRLLDDRESYDQFLSDWRNRDLFLIRGMMTGSPQVTGIDSLLNRDFQWRHFYSNEEDKIPQTSYYLVSRSQFVAEVERAFKSAKADGKKQFSEKNTVSDAFYLQNLKHELHASRIIEARILVERRFLLLSLALQTFKAGHGHFPKDLAQLSPEILASLPTDPYSAIKTTFGFKSNGKDYLLYSVGYNGIDESKELPANYSDRFSTVSPAFKDWDDIIFSRQPNPGVSIPAGTIPQKPSGLPPLYTPSPYSTSAGPPASGGPPAPAGP